MRLFADGCPFFFFSSGAFAPVCSDRGVEYRHVRRMRAHALPFNERKEGMVGNDGDFGFRWEDELSEAKGPKRRPVFMLASAALLLLAAVLSLAVLAGLITTVPSHVASSSRPASLSVSDIAAPVDDASSSSTSEGASSDAGSSSADGSGSSSAEGSGAESGQDE